MVLVHALFFHINSNAKYFPYLIFYSILGPNYSSVYHFCEFEDKIIFITCICSVLRMMFCVRLEKKWIAWTRTFNNDCFNTLYYLKQVVSKILCEYFKSHILESITKVTNIFIIGHSSPTCDKSHICVLMCSMFALY